MDESEIKAVQMVREIRDDLYQRTEAMTADELIRFFRLRAAAARRKLEELHTRGGELVVSPR